jgi:hypothetical protein
MRKPKEEIANKAYVREQLIDHLKGLALGAAHSAEDHATAIASILLGPPPCVQCGAPQSGDRRARPSRESDLEGPVCDAYPACSSPTA